MTHDDDLWLDALLDDELDAAASLALQRRLEHEPALQARWEERRALRAQVREGATRHAAPPGLLQSVEATLGIVAARVEPRIPVAATGRPRAFARLARPLLHAGAGALAAALVTLGVVDPAALGLGARHAAGVTVAQAEDDTQEAGEAVSAHTRALLVDHAIEVASSDQHTVRPWLSARLNFVPPVVDLAAQGYTLLGARRDVLAGETAAALVYRHGAHVISVFVRPVPPATSARADPPRVVRGFNVIQRTQGGMAFCFVSDANPHELAALADLLAPAK